MLVVLCFARKRLSDDGQLHGQSVVVFANIADVVVDIVDVYVDSNGRFESVLQLSNPPVTSQAKLNPAHVGHGSTMRF